MITKFWCVMSRLMDLEIHRCDNFESHINWFLFHSADAAFLFIYFFIYLPQHTEPTSGRLTTDVIKETRHWAVWHLKENFPNSSNQAISTSLFYTHAIKTKTVSEQNTKPAFLPNIFTLLQTYTIIIIIIIIIILLLYAGYLHLYS
jgi:hypothetical protein